MSKTLEEKLQEVVEKSIIEKVSRGHWLTVRTGRLEMDDKFLKEVYDSVDMDKVLKICVDKLETKLADKILNNMATELATDVKSILSDTQLREEVRFYLRKNIKEKAEKLS